MGPIAVIDLNQCSKSLGILKELNLQLITGQILLASAGRQLRRFASRLVQLILQLSKLVCLDLPDLTIIYSAAMNLSLHPSLEPVQGIRNRIVLFI